MKTILKGASILTAILMFSMVLTPALAAVPPVPYERWGVADVNDAYITSWIDGVSYGNDVTGVSSGAYSIDTAGDGDSSDNVKNGGTQGAGDVIRYARGNLTGATGIFFTETDSPWSVGGSTNGALTSGTSVNLLKISIVASQSGLSTDDYIALYNPTGVSVDATGYSLAVGTGAASAILAGDIAGNTNPIPASGLLYIDMTAAKWGGLSTTGNSIQLYYGVNIIDRVEYGTIATEPQNTMMPNAAAPTSGNEIYRTPTYATDSNDCLVDFGSQAASLPSAGGTTPSNVWANKTAGVVRLEWSGGAAPFEIFISNNVDGTGFNFASANETTSDMFWTHSVLGDGNSYSYIVLGEGDAVTPHPNMAFKLAKQISQPGGAHINWVAVPYVSELTNLGEVATDISSTASITWQVRAWDSANQNYKEVIYDDLGMVWVGDTTFAIGPGDAVLIFCNQAAGIWDVVGSHDSGYSVSVAQPGGAHINWIGLPANHATLNLGAAAGDISPTASISWQVRAWDTANQNYKEVIYDDLGMVWVGDTTFVLGPCDAILIFCNQAPGSYVPTCTTP